MEPAPRLYLASASPRRRELLTQIGLPHTVLQVPAPAGEDEPILPGESGADYVQRTAREKAERGLDWLHAQALPALPVLGKPATRAEALQMLQALSGRRHEVRTAVVLGWQQRLHEAVSVTQVQMRALSLAECERYCDSGEPFGKAGAYGIQGLAGSFIAHIEGSYSAVMGLPLFETAQLLRHAGIELP